MPKEPLAKRVDVLESDMTSLKGELREFRAEVHERFERLEVTIRRGDEDTRGLIRESEDETRRLMRGLHEDVLERIARIGEGRP
jgi:hypothetical protein